jgi:hypothetical protein
VRAEMIKAVTNDGEIIFMLEPGNVTKLQTGEPLSVNLRELGVLGEIKIYWTPDVIRLAMDMALEKEKNRCITADWLDKKIKESLEWRVLDRVAS